MVKQNKYLESPELRQLKQIVQQFYLTQKISTPVIELVKKVQDQYMSQKDIQNLNTFILSYTEFLEKQNMEIHKD